MLVRGVYILGQLILNTTIINNKVYDSHIGSLMTVVNIILELVMFFCFWRGLCAVSKKANLQSKAGAALAMFVWHAFMYLLAVYGCNDNVMLCIMIVIFVIIMRSLYMMSKKIAEAGYSIDTAPVKVADYTIVVSIIAIIFIGCFAGYMFGGSYRMNWALKDIDEHESVLDIKENLMSLGFSEDVLDDLSTDDITSCEGALKVVENVSHKNELCITSVAVQIPGEDECWKIFHHFCWVTNPGFYGTESLQLWPVYNNQEGWGYDGDASGRVLYDKDGEVYVAPYQFIGNKTYTSENMIFGRKTSTDIFANFSLPDNGENQRGYISYSIIELDDGWDAVSWINYTHQKNWMQYPAITAMQVRMEDSFDNPRAFETIQESFRIFESEYNEEIID